MTDRRIVLGPLRVPLRTVLLLIGVLTVGTGAVQVVAPGFILGLLGAETTPTTRHFFGIVGMFMLLFGGLLCHALLSSTPHPVAVQWAAWQKFGAAGAVALGAARAIFSPLALAVAGFDLLSGVLILWYWRSLRA